MAAPSEEKLIGDKFNLEALTVNQVKSFKALADGKDVFIGTKTGSGIFAYISSITCAPSSDWIRVLVAVTNEILKRESSKCILDPPRVERRGTRIVTLGLRRWLYRGRQIYWLRKPEYPEKTTDLSQVTDKHLSHNVVHLALSRSPTHNISGDRHRLHK